MNVLEIHKEKDIVMGLFIFQENLEVIDLI
jgi:hypothetical protein